MCAASSQEPYLLAFVGAHAMIPEFVTLGGHLLRMGDVASLRPELLDRPRSSTRKRQFNELTRRLKQLTPVQLELLVHGDRPDQLAVTHLALLKTYRFYYDFVVEVLREKLLTYDFTLSKMDYAAFVSRKSLEDSKLASIAETTEHRVRQVVLQMLQQVELLVPQRPDTIQRPMLSPAAEQAVAADHLRWLKGFLYSDEQIQAVLDDN